MFLETNHSIIILTGQPANGKTLCGKLMQDRAGFICIEGDDFITPNGKTRLNNGQWNDIDRKIYLTHLAATTVDTALTSPKVVVVDCLTTQWMRKFLLDQITTINNTLAIGFILLERHLTQNEIMRIANLRKAQGHALEPEALIKFRTAFEPWDTTIPHEKVVNPGNNDMHQLLMAVLNGISKL